MTVPAPSRTAASSHMWLFEFLIIKQNENFKLSVTFLSKVLGSPAWPVLLCGTAQIRTCPSLQRSTDSTVLDGRPTSGTNWCSEILGSHTLKEASELTLETRRRIGMKFTFTLRKVCGEFRAAAGQEGAAPRSPRSTSGS